MVNLLSPSFISPVVQRRWEIVFVLAERNLRVRYRGSVLGVYWSLLNPLAITVLYTLIFGTFFAHGYGSINRYAIAAFIGLVIVNFFAAATSQSLTSVVDDAALLNKLPVPVEAFPVAANLANVFQLLIGTFPILAILTFWQCHRLLNVFALLLPLSALFLVCLGIGFLVSALYVFFRDLSYFYDLMIFVLSISSPIIYPYKMLTPWMKSVLWLNPLVPIIESTRQIIMSGAVPDMVLVGKSFVDGALIFALGWLLFYRCRYQFMDLL